MKSILIGLIAALFLSWAFTIYVYRKFAVSSERSAAYWKKEASKPDTVYSKSFYTDVPRPYLKDYMRPDTVYFYPIMPEEKSAKVTVGFDTLGMLSVFDSLSRVRTPIAKNYLTQFPGANKLIHGTFDRDKIRVDLLGTDGLIKTETYPVDYSTYKYQYINNSFRAEELSASEKKKDTQSKSKFYNGTYVEYQRDFLHGGNDIRISSHIDLGKFRLGGFAQQPLTSGMNGTKPSAGATVGIKLF